MVSALLCTAVCAPAWWYSHRQKYFYAWEVVLPVLPILIWMVLTFFRIGAQSLGNLVELPLVVGVFTAAVYLKSFAFKRWGIPLRAGAAILAALALLVPMIFRLSFPWMPE